VNRFPILTQHEETDLARRFRDSGDLEAARQLKDAALSEPFALVREAALAASKAQLEKLLSYPRPEDVPPAEAKVKAASETLEDLKAQLALWESIADPRAVVKEEFDRRRFAVRIAEIFSHALDDRSQQLSYP
jgi:hypothetical protein